MFTAHLRVTMECLTRYCKQKVVQAAMLKGKRTPSNMVAKTNKIILLP